MIPIPSFPAFRPLKITDRPLIESATSPFPPYSDFGFTSLWAWDTDEICALACLDGNLIVRLADYTTGAPFYSFIGDTNVLETALTLLDHARREGMPARLGLIPHTVIAADPRLAQHLTVAEDPDNHDYIYSIPAWVTLAGSPFRRQRQRVRRCCPRTAFTVRSLDLGACADQSAMTDLFARWEAQKSESGPGVHRTELEALRRAFALAPHGRLGAFGIDDGGTLIAFSVWEELPRGHYCQSHFRKTLRSYEGLSDYLQHEESKLLAARGYCLMNFEQDLGIPGLRDYKSSLRPCGFLRKYTISE